MKREKEESCRVRARVGKSHGDVSVKKKLLHVDSRKRDRKGRKKSAESASPVVSTSADCVMERAKEIQSSLPPELPTFIKSMLHSHVAGRFWLGLPKCFCDLHFPKKNSMVFLEDEDGKVYETKYLSEKVCLSAGWKGYSIAHGLREGDVLVFQLVEPCHWKVFLSRTDNVDEVDGALSRLNVGSRKHDREGRKKSAESASMGVSASADCVMERAKEIQSSLPPELPTLVKSMLPSHVAGGFWLGLPKRFCDLHLPKQDLPVFLEDEDGKVYETKYLSEKVGLSAGWRGYSIAHGLREGDVLVFQLIEPCHWKVFLSRAGNLDEVDGARSCLQLFPPCKGLKKRKYEQMGSKSSPKMPRKKSVEVLSPEQDRPEEADQVSEILDGIRLCEFRVRFEDIKQAADFVVAVNGLVISGELTTHVRNKYYHLCLSKKHFLHENLVKGLNCKLVVGIISETVNIADAIHASKVTISAEDFKVWETTLRAFQDLGMEVGFLLTRLRRLMTLAAVWKKLTDELGDADEKLVEAEDIANLELIFQNYATLKW